MFFSNAKSEKNMTQFPQPFYKFCAQCYSFCCIGLNKLFTESDIEFRISSKNKKSTKKNPTIHVFDEKKNIKRRHDLRKVLVTFQNEYLSYLNYITKLPKMLIEGEKVFVKSSNFNSF